MRARGLPVAAGLALLLTGCASLRQVRALRQVDFTIDRVSAVRLAGMSLEPASQLADLGAREAGRIAAAVARRNVPLELVVHLRAENPARNRVTARLIRMRWTLALNGRETVSGTIDTVYTFPPGEPRDVPVPIRLDLYEFFRTSAGDALDLAAGLLGIGGRTTVVELMAVPTVDTPLGAIRYPGTITIRRTVAP